MIIGRDLTFLTSMTRFGVYAYLEFGKNYSSDLCPGLHGDR